MAHTVKGRQPCTVYACACYTSITEMNSTLDFDSRQKRQVDVSVTGLTRHVQHSTDRYGT